MKNSPRQIRVNYATSTQASTDTALLLRVWQRDGPAISECKDSLVKLALDSSSTRMALSISVRKKLWKTYPVVHRLQDGARTRRAKLLVKFINTSEVT